MKQGMVVGASFGWVASTEKERGGAHESHGAKAESLLSCFEYSGLISLRSSKPHSVDLRSSEPHKRRQPETSFSACRPELSESAERSSYSEGDRAASTSSETGASASGILPKRTRNRSWLSRLGIVR